MNSMMTWNRRSRLRRRALALALGIGLTLCRASALARAGTHVHGHDDAVPLRGQWTLEPGDKPGLVTFSLESRGRDWVHSWSGSDVPLAEFDGLQFPAK